MLNSGADKSTWGTALWASTLGITFVLSVAVSLLIGHYLDKWLGTRPVLTLVFSALGLFAGVREVVREAKRLNRKVDEEMASRRSGPQKRTGAGT